MFVLHVDTLKARAMFAPRSRTVKKSFEDLQSTVQNFSAMNSAWPCYACVESLNRMKIEKEHIYDKHFYRRDVYGVSLFHSHISLPGIFNTFKAKLKEGILKKKLKIHRKERGGSFITAPFIFLWVLFQIDVDITKPVV